MEAMIATLGLSTAFSIETGLAVFVSLFVSFIIFLVIRRVPFITKVILPGLNLTRNIRTIVLKWTEEKSRTKLDLGQYILISAALLAYAIRGGASIIVIGWVFATMMAAVAPLFSL